MHVLQRIAGIAPVALVALAGCLRDTTHACETTGACGDDDARPSDAADLLDAPLPDGNVGPDAPAQSQIDVGRGVDGPLMVSGATAVDARINTCARLSAVANAGASAIGFDPSTQVSANAAANLAMFVADRRVIVWQTAGLPSTAITIGDQAPFMVPATLGRYEVATVTTVTPGGGGGATTLSLAAPLAGSYTASAQVCRVPELTDLTVANGIAMPMAQLRPPPWNGTVGGLLAFYASGTVTIGGSGAGGAVVASGRGMRQGIANNFPGSTEDCTALVGDPLDGGGNHKGEGLATVLYSTSATGAANTFGLGNAVNGGGGGGCHNAGGAGGGNGGRGGRGGDQADPDPLGAGLGGAALVLDARTQLAMGGGGGAGDADDDVAGDGGVGGGVIWVHASTLTCSFIRTVGSGGGNSGVSTRDGAGGGGAGGMIVAEIRTLGPCTFDAAGGGGGRGYLSGNSTPSGPGGGGGGGRIYLRTDARAVEPQVGVGGGAAGIVADGTGTWGATGGGAGVVCGNGVIEAGEACDDGGNANPGDGCDYCR